MMSQISFGADQFLERAQWMTKELTRMHSRGPGDTANAMHKLERLYGIEYWWTHRLRYEFARLKDISAGVYARIEAAYIAECDRQDAINQQRREVAESYAFATRILDECAFEQRCSEAEERISAANGSDKGAP